MLNDNNAKEIFWTDAKSQNEFDQLHINGVYIDKAVVVFNGSKDEVLGEGGYLNGKGANVADVIVYGPDGADDIKHYVGFTMSSNKDKFGVIDNGTYTVNRVPVHGILELEWAIENKGQVNALNGINNSNKKSYLVNTYIHRTNLDGFAGYNEKTGSAVSKGCLLILASQWELFSQQLSTINIFTLFLNRE